MNYFLNILLLSAGLILFLFLVFLFLSKKMVLSFEKYSSFECGFDPFSFSRFPFSLRFFKIGLIFLLFDVEIIMIFPIPIYFSLNYYFVGVVILVVIIILLGLLLEWKMGSLNWMK